MYEQLNEEISGDESTTETNELSPGVTADNYGSTSAPDKPIDHPFYIPRCGLVFYIMAFFGFFCALMLREGLSVAIVAMVNQTAVVEIDLSIINATGQEICPREPELTVESGEFNWNRMEQEVLLAAFYCGFVITQVKKAFIYSC